MRSKPPRHFRIELIFAGVHSSFWMSMCTFSGFMAVYLSYYGFSDSLIGLTASAVSLITIAFQLFISTFSDAHLHIPIKRIITAVYFLTLGLVAVLALLPMSLILMMIVFSLAGGLFNSLPGLFNAQVIQFINAGIPVNFGWPRGVSSIAYALTAFFIGQLLENYSPTLLMPICLILIVAAIIMISLLPRPDEETGDEAIPELMETGERTSLRQLLSSSRVLQVFLLSSIFMSAGQSNLFLFLTRIIEAAGGNKADLGLAMFIQAGIEMPAMFLIPRLLRRFRARAILVFSVTAYLVKIMLIYFSSSLAGIYAAMAVSVFCFGLYGMTSVFFVNDIVRYNEKVRAQTLVTASGAFSAIIYNLGAGWIVQAFGIRTLNLICMLLQVIAASLMGLCAYLQMQDEKNRGIRPALP